MLSTEWISSDDERWASTLKRTRHDVYHLPSYVRTDAELVGGRPMAYLAEEDDRVFFLPWVVRTMSRPTGECSEYRDAASPYGFAGPCVRYGDGDSPQDEAVFLNAAIKGLHAAMRDAKIIAGFVRLHPLLQQGNRLLQHHGHLVNHGQTVFCDLKSSEAELWSQTRKRDRTYINHARRSGFRVIRDHQWNRLHDFVELYYESMRRVAAKSHYYFPYSYFTSLKRRLADNASLFLVVDSHDRVASGGIFTECQGIVQYHLGGTASPFLKQHPSKLMLHHVRRWSKARGNHSLHLGGGVSSQADSLFHFKSGFSKLRASFSSCRLIANQPEYDRLVASWETSHDLAADTVDGYFPAYRKPGISKHVPQNRHMPAIVTPHRLRSAA